MGAEGAVLPDVKESTLGSLAELLGKDSGNI